jgi:hypothetical protein
MSWRRSVFLRAGYPFVFFVAIGLQWIPISVRAHHATATQFDTSKTIRIKGVVSRLDWANPHVHVYMDVREGRGVDGLWDIELASPGGIIVSGLSKESLKPGTALTVVGYPGKANGALDASNAAGGRLPTNRSLCATQLTLTDGATATFTVGI